MKCILAVLMLVSICYAQQWSPPQCIRLPQKGLKDFYSGCRTGLASRQMSCATAMRKFCASIEFAFIGHLVPLAGVSRNFTSTFISMSCVTATAFEWVTPKDMKFYNKGCDKVDKSSTSDCLDAFHQYCNSRFQSIRQAGIAQGSSHHAIYIACFKTEEVTLMEIAALEQMDPKCNDVQKSGIDHCFAAAYKLCIGLKKGYSGGVTQGVQYGKVRVACYKNIYSGNVPIKMKKNQESIFHQQIHHDKVEETLEDANEDGYDWNNLNDYR